MFLRPVPYLCPYAVNLIGIYSSLTFVIVVGQILIGAGGYTILITGYVILSEVT